MVLLFINYFRGAKKEASIFGTLFALSALMVYNQQLITGKSIQSPHYHFMTTVPMIIVFTVIFTWTCFQKISIFKVFFAGVSRFFRSCDIFVNNFNWQMLSYEHTKRYGNSKTRLCRLSIGLNKTRPKTILSFPALRFPRLSLFLLRLTFILPHSRNIICCQKCFQAANLS